MTLEEKFLKAYDDFSDAIFRHCYFKVSNGDKAKDLTQETFTRVWEYMSKNGEVKNIKAFLYRIAGNLVIDDYRKKKEASLNKLMDAGFDVGTDPVQPMLAKLEYKEMLGHINKLENNYKEVVMMRHVDDLSIKEISEVLGESENNISVRIHRGLAKLRELIGDK